MKFTEKGHITLRARVLGANDGVSMIRFEIEDTGIGIAHDKQVMIFEPFAQADDSITRVYGGTGLGTTIARHLVTLMGGRIDLTSNLGVGTRFWFEIPLPYAELRGIDLTEELSSTIKVSATVRALSTSNLASVHKLRGARILVAEDNQTNQRVTQVVLESGGHVVTIVDNGEAALDALERGGFDLALVDLSMPIVSGLEALKLYRFSTRNPIPVLILSANVTTELIDECMRAGAAEFVTKPIRASVLLDAVERNLEIEPILNSIAAPPLRAEDRQPLQVVDTPPMDASVLEDLGACPRIRRLSSGYCVAFVVIPSGSSVKSRMRLRSGSMRRSRMRRTRCEAAPQAWARHN